MKKTIFSLVMMLFMAFSVCLTGCKDPSLSVNPKTEETVISNGGLSVIKGDYLYFVNGYTDISDSSFNNNSNKWGNVGKSGIYRTKLSNGEISKDEEGFLNNADLVVPKVVGFRNGGFYIIDDYIYYTTPNNRSLDRDGNPQKDRLEFRRVNINGSKKSDQLLYVTESSSTSPFDWTVRKLGDKVYLLVNDGDKLVSYNSTDLEKVVEVSVSGENSSYSFFNDDSYVYNQERKSVGENYVYYTRPIDSDKDSVSSGFSGNVICRFNIATGEIDERLELLDNNVYTIINASKDTIYYTIKNTSGIAKLYKKVIMNSSSEWATIPSIQLTNSEYTNYYFAGHGNDLILATDGTNTYKLEGTNNVKPVALTSSRDILAIYGNYAYYVVEDDLIRFDIHSDGESETVLENVSEENGTHTIANKNYLDFDGQNIYVYSQYVAENSDQNFYLDYIDSASLTQRFVGVFEEDDVPAVPEQPEDEEDEDGNPVKIPHID